MTDAIVNPSKTRKITSIRKIFILDPGKKADAGQIREHFIYHYGGEFQTATELLRFCAQAEAQLPRDFLKDYGPVPTGLPRRLADNESEMLPFGVAFEFRQALKDLMQDDRYALIRDQVSDLRIDRLLGEVTGDGIFTLDEVKLSKEAVEALFKEEYHDRFESIQEMVYFYGRCQAMHLKDLAAKEVWNIHKLAKAINPTENKKLVRSEPDRLIEGLYTGLNDEGDERFCCIPDEQRSKEAITELVALEITKQKARRDPLYGAVAADGAAEAESNGSDAPFLCSVSPKTVKVTNVARANTSVE